MFSKRYDSDEGQHQKVEEKSGAGKEVDDNKVWLHFDIDAPLDEDSLLGDDFMNGGCMPSLPAIQKRCLPSSRLYGIRKRMCEATHRKAP